MCQCFCFTRKDKSHWLKQVSHVAKWQSGARHWIWGEGVSWKGVGRFMKEWSEGGWLVWILKLQVSPCLVGESQAVKLCPGTYSSTNYWENEERGYDQNIFKCFYSGSSQSKPTHWQSYQIWYLLSFSASPQLMNEACITSQLLLLPLSSWCSVVHSSPQNIALWNTQQSFRSQRLTWQACIQTQALP